MVNLCFFELFEHYSIEINLVDANRYTDAVTIQMGLHLEKKNNCYLLNQINGMRF